MSSSISIVIPVQNEEPQLSGLFQNLKMLKTLPSEVLVVDGASKDETSNIVKEQGHKLITCLHKSKAVRLNEGGYYAKGDVLVFLNAETRVPPDFIDIVNTVMDNRRVVLGGFTSVVHKNNKICMRRKIPNFLKTYLGAFLYNPFRCTCYGLRILLNDQAIFCRREDFLKVGGFDLDLPIMEDIDFCVRINRLGSVRQVSRRVESFHSELSHLSVNRDYWRFLMLAMLWAFGISPHWLRSQYDDYY